ncbi:alpha-1-antichymotrypsin-like isoform X1 [Macrotis lagotis]|uniref:alpha-1-antichymotrypsin-like isoform X1 n=1 Tax=Macrotis lagotis TaxID=92651 RepID=UPI003D682F40
MGRMESSYFLVLLLAIFYMNGLCFPNPEEVQTGNQNQEEQPISSKISTSNADFAFHLYKKLASDNSSKNVLFSPMSISTAFALLSLGARGTTLTQLLEGLKFNLTEISEAEIHRGFQQLIHSFNLPNDMFQLSTGNALFISKYMEFLEKFQEDSKSLYSTEVFPTNFQNTDLATQQVNDYVKKQTQGKIENLFDRLNENTVIVLVNYIFYKAKWETPFDSDDTYNQNFFVSEEKVVEVPMMHQDEFYTRVFQDKELFCTVVELKYKGNATALFILPDQKKMSHVENALNSEVLEKWLNSLQTRKIDLFLPKFSISSNYELEKVLPLMGIEELFTTKANLSGITGQENIQVSKVVHKAVLDVDEAGTEAAAATGIEMMLTSIRRDPLPMIKFDRPFIVILNSQSSMLFIGKVNNPLKA